jgi:hypothetical protein
MTHTTTSAAALLTSATLALAATGCSGISDPLNERSLSFRPSEATRSPNEVGIPRHARPSRTALAAAAPTPTAAIERFAALYINWSERTLAAHQRQLAAISIGEASSAEAQAAAHTPADYELHRSHLGNRGRVIAITSTLPRRPGAFVVVTHERTTGTSIYDQLAPTYHLTFATVQRLPGGWAVSQWRPQI